MELGCGVRWNSLVVLSFLLVIASCSDNEILVANCDVLGAVVMSTLGRQFMMSNFIFNINSFWTLPHLSFCIVTPQFIITKWVGVSQ